jgi:Xaa-Pro aminopeptidase
MINELEERFHRGLPPELPINVWKERIERCRNLLEKAGMDALLVYSGGQALTGVQWARYFANYVHPLWNSEAFILIPLEEDPVLIVNYPFIVNHAKEMTPIKDVRAYKYFGRDLYTPARYETFESLLKTIIKEKDMLGKKIGLGRQGMQGDYLPAVLERALYKALEGTTVEDSSALMWRLAMHKTDYDIKQIKKMCHIACDALKDGFMALGEGKTGFESFAAFALALGKYGAEIPGWYPTTWHYSIKGGIEIPNRPFWVTYAKFKKGDMVPIDTGLSYKGYTHDMCRTAIIGQPSNTQRRIQEANINAQKAMQEALKPGVRASELSKINFEMAKKAGYDKIHDLQGHGLGFFENEPPIITPWSDIIIEKNMIINLECVIYVTGIGISYVEDTFLVTDDGNEWLTDTMHQDLWVR